MSKIKVVTKEVRAVIAPQIAAAIVRQEPTEDIAKAHGLSERQVKSITKSDEFKEAINELMEHSKTMARSKLAIFQDTLMSEAITALRSALSKGSVEGVKLVFKSLGLLDEEQSNDQVTQINVTLPGSPQEGSVDASFQKLQD